MKPEDVLHAIAAQRGDADRACPTMTTAPAWRSIAPDDLSVGCVGFMGGASSLGLGLALARPDRRVLVLDGDGSLLMQLGSLATVAGAAPAEPRPLPLQERRLPHVRARRGSRAACRSTSSMMAQGAGYRMACSPSTSSATSQRRLPELLDGRGPGVRRAPHRAGRADADDRPRARRRFHQQLHDARSSSCGPARAWRRGRLTPVTRRRRPPCHSIPRPSVSSTRWPQLNLKPVEDSTPDGGARVAPHPHRGARPLRGASRAIADHRVPVAGGDDHRARRTRRAGPGRIRRSSTTTAVDG